MSGLHGVVKRNNFLKERDVVDSLLKLEEDTSTALFLDTVLEF